MELYFKELSKIQSVSAVALKAEFINIFSDDHNFIPLNNALYHPKDFLRYPFQQSFADLN